MEQTEDIKFPSIVFKLGGNYYSIDSKYVATIMKMGKTEKLPDANPYIQGISMFNGDVLQLLNMRMVFDLPTQEDAYREFAEMIEMRKQDHISWVEELDASVQNNTPFTLATDPHQCAFGKWYDQFESENTEVKMHMKMIDEPHHKLHDCALDVMNCSQECDQCKREECLKVTLDKARNNYMPMVVKLLDESKEIFREKVFNEMVLVLQGECRTGLIVDQVVMVEDLVGVEGEGGFYDFMGRPFFHGVKKHERVSALILEINVPEIMQSVLGVEMEA